MDKKINYFHLLILIYLLTLGAIEFHVEITSGQLSKIINKSQQTTSKILIELEKESLIERITFKGKIVNGMGEGAYYMSLDEYKKQFKEKLGYEPFPGTLNLKLEDRTYTDKKKEISNYPSIFIHGFKDENRTFGWVKCYPAILIARMEINNNLEKDHRNLSSKE